MQQVTPSPRDTIGDTSEGTATTAGANVSKSRPSALTAKVLASYSAIGIPMAAMGMPIAVYLPPLYSSLGLSLATVGLVFTLVRIFDVVTDPIMGLAIDRFDTRWGRRKHWIALAVPILLVSVWMVFLPNPESVSALYLGFWMVMLYIGYTMMTIAHQSWGAELSQSYDDRSRLFGWREVFVIGGMTAVLAVPAALDSFGDNVTLRDKVASMGLFCLVLFPLTAIPTLWNVPDSSRKAANPVDWLEATQVLIGNPLLWRILASDLLSGLGTGVAGALYIFIARFVFELPEESSLALLFYFLAAFGAMPLWLKLAYRVGKARAMRIALVYGSAIMLLLYFVFAQPGSVLGLWAFTIFYGVAYGAAPALLRSMMADLTDADELEVGEQRAGLFFALLTTTNKLGAAFAVGACFWVLDKGFGFDPKIINTPEAVDGVLITYCVGTAIGLFLAYIPMINYPLTSKKHAEIRAKLEARSAQASV